MNVMPTTPNHAEPAHPNAGPNASTNASTGARLVATDGRPLPLRGTEVTVRASGGLARVVLVQRFENPYDEALTVRYQLPLPADGAVSGFAFRLGDRRIVGEIDGRDRARNRFEKAIVEGRSAGLVEQTRSSLFNQELGNLPPRATVLAEITVDQPLAWIDEGCWEWRFPTVVAPRYQGAPGRVPDRDAQTVDVADGQLDARAELELVIADALAEGGAPISQTHPLRVTEGRETVVRFRSGAGAALDRDIAIRWPARQDDVTTRLEVARPEAGHPGAEDGFGLLTLVPPAGGSPQIPRDLILLLDTSGSMNGEPLAQARRVATALVESLSDEDSLQMVAFSSSVSHWHQEPRRADRTTRQSAVAWLDALRAGGGTEMHAGILAALEPLRGDAQRQVILVTDGLIGFEDEIVGAIESRLPRGCRVHCVGVGSAVNRSLTGPAARAGRGVESICALGEDAERVARRLVAHCAAPLVVDLEVTGSALREHAPHALPDLLAGAPALLSLRLDPAGGALRVTGRTASGPWEQTLEVGAIERGEGSQALVVRFARERVEDLETSLAAAPERRGAIDAELERLALDFQIASRLTSWVAISDEVDTDPRAPGRRETMPHELPHGMSLAGLGLRSPQPRMWAARSASGALAIPMSVSGGAPPPGFGAPPPPAAPPPPGAFGGAPRGAAGAPPPAARPAAPPAPAPSPAEPPPPQDEGAAEIRAQASVSEAFLSEADLSDDAELAGGMAEDEPAEIPQRSRGRKSLARRLLDGVRDVFGAGDATEAAGRIVVRDDDHLVIEITIPTELDWSPEAARVTLADGQEVQVTVTAEASTRPGPMVPGQTVRLTVALAAPLASPPTAVHLTLARGRMTILLSP